MKHILIPTDFSPNAQVAADYAFSIFNSADYTITFLNTFYLPTVTAGSHFNRKGTTQAKADKDFNKELERVILKFPDNKASIAFRFELGDVVSVVEFLLKSEEFYAIVMGTKGSSNSKESLIGSRTSHMVNSIQTPIFVIPENGVYTQIKKVVITTDLAHIPLDDSLELLKDLCTRQNASIDLLNVKNNNDHTTSHKEIKQKLTELLYPIKHFFVSVDNDDITKGILSYLKQTQPDLLISVNERKGFFERIFHKSITKEITLHTDMPLLVINGRGYK